MRKRYTIALSVLVGIVTGVAGPYVVHSQEEQPVYMIALNEVTNPDGYKNEYLPPAQMSIKQYGGTYVAGGAGNSDRRDAAARSDRRAAMGEYGGAPTLAHLS